MALEQPCQLLGDQRNNCRATNPYPLGAAVIACKRRLSTYGGELSRSKHSGVHSGIEDESYRSDGDGGELHFGAWIREEDGLIITMLVERRWEAEPWEKWVYIHYCFRLKYPQALIRELATYEDRHHVHARISPPPYSEHVNNALDNDNSPSTGL